MGFWGLGVTPSQKVGIGHSLCSTQHYFDQLNVFKVGQMFSISSTYENWLYANKPIASTIQPLHVEVGLTFSPHGVNLQVHSMY